MNLKRLFPYKQEGFLILLRLLKEAGWATN